MTEAQYQANIENARLSTGPRTESGKYRSSLSARRHQLTAKTYIAPPDEMEAYDAHCAAWRQALAPVGFQESEIVEEIARDKFRLKKAAAIEQSVFAQGHLDYAGSAGTGIEPVDGALAEAKTWKECATSLQTLVLYESRLRRAVEKNEAKLEALQTTRKQEHERARQEAIRLTKEAADRGERYEPEDDFEPASQHGGFVYSFLDIAHAIHREYRLAKSPSGPRRVTFGGANQTQVEPSRAA